MLIQSPPALASNSPVLAPGSSSTLWGWGDGGPEPRLMQQKASRSWGLAVPTPAGSRKGSCRGPTGRRAPGTHLIDQIARVYKMAGVTLKRVVACRASQPQPETNPSNVKRESPNCPKLLKPNVGEQESARPHLAGAVLRLVGEARDLFTKQAAGGFSAPRQKTVRATITTTTVPPQPTSPLQTVCAFSVDTSWFRPSLLEGCRAFSSMGSSGCGLRHRPLGPGCQRLSILGAFRQNCVASSRM